MTVRQFNILFKTYLFLCMKKKIRNVVYFARRANMKLKRHYMIHVCIFKGEKYSILISEFRLNFRKQIVFKAVLFKITVGNSNNDVTFYMLAYILDY